MAHITFVPVHRAPVPAPLLPHRLSVLLRAWRLARRRGRRIRVADEIGDPHLARDTGLVPSRHRRHDCLVALAAVLGNGSRPS